MTVEARVDEVQAVIQARADSIGGNTKTALGDPTGTPDFYPGTGWEEPGQAWDPAGVFRALLWGVLDAIDLPVGTVLPFAGTPGALPVGWAVADGTGGTADLRGAYLKGAIGSPPAPGPDGLITEGAGTGVAKEVVWIQKVS